MLELRWAAVAAAVTSILALSGCSDPPVAPRDSGLTDTGVTETGGTDTGVTDTGVNDTGMIPTDGGVTDGAPTTVTVTGNITSNTTWTSDRIYRLEGGPVFVTNNAVLTIQAGTRIVAEKRDSTRLDGGPPAQEGTALVITRGARIEANGTAENPIVFTSAAASPEPGDWGGVVLLGRARTNIGGTGAEGSIEGLRPGLPEGQYGGSDDASNCGTLRYVRIEYAGYVYGTNNELNSLTVGACGSATTLEYIQVHRGLDDGAEFFAGTANIKYLIVTAPGDDALDWTEGWTGKAQFILIHHRFAAGEERCIEADGNPTMPSAAPRSSPTVYNMTCIGPGNDIPSAAQSATMFRVGTQGIVRNSLFLELPKDGLRVLDTTSSMGAVTVDTTPGLTAGTLVLERNMLFEIGNSGTAYYNTTGDVFETELAANNYSGMDPGYPASTICRVVGTCNVNNFVPPASSPLATVTRAPLPASDTFFTAANFLGAVEPGTTTPWYAGWARFTP